MVRCPQCCVLAVAYEDARSTTVGSPFDRSAIKLRSQPSISCPLASASGGSDPILLEPLPWCGSDSQPLPIAIVALYSVLVQHIAKFSQKSGRISAVFDLICQSRLTTTVRRLGSPNTGTQGRHRLINAMLKAWRDRHAKARVRGACFLLRALPLAIVVGGMRGRSPDCLAIRPQRPSRRSRKRPMRPSVPYSVLATDIASIILR